MNYRERLTEISKFLKPYQRIWQNEIMLMYPNPFDEYPMEWIKEIATFKDKEDVLTLERKQVHGLLKNPELLAYYDKIEELSRFPDIPTLPEMPVDAHTFVHMIPKKQYEIKRFAPFVNHLYQEHAMETVIDIGGGIGKLAQTLNNQYGLKVKSFDMDPALQVTGKKRHEKNARDPHNQVQFFNVKVEENSEELHKHLGPKTLSVGLHTCGNLATDLIRSCVRFKSNIINLGCCFHRMVGNNQNLSTFAQNLPNRLDFNLFALTLGTRGHRKIGDKDYLFKMNVKYYRYALHILLYDHYDQKELLTVGNSHVRLYNESFGVYAEEQFRRVGIKLKHSTEELNAFYQRPELQTLIWNMLAANIVRNALGRLIEVYLLLDRAIYLEEQGYKVELHEFFDETISPRNIGITATL